MPVTSPDVDLGGPWPKMKARRQAPPVPEPELPPRTVYEDQYREQGGRYKSHSQLQRLSNRRQAAVAEAEKETRTWHKAAWELKCERDKAQAENKKLQKLCDDQNAELEYYKTQKNAPNIEEKDNEIQSLQAKIAILRKRNVYLETEWQLEVNELRSKLDNLEQLRRQQVAMYEGMRQRMATQLVNRSTQAILKATASLPVKSQLAG